jgi:enamine deaminase RidA (YjgF/YER057c/UK114 family)
MISSSPIVVPLQQQRRRFVHIERRLEDLGITLPKPAAPRANYSPVLRVGDMMYVSGHLPFDVDGTLMTGRIGDQSTEGGGGSSQQIDLDHGYQAARLCGLNIISTLQSQLDGDLDRVVKIVKLFGIVQSNESFKSQHLVMDGCSDVMMEVFGEIIGLHARSAIGTSTLPLDMSVEVEAIVQVRD